MTNDSSLHPSTYTEASTHYLSRPSFQCIFFNWVKIHLHQRMPWLDSKALQLNVHLLALAVADVRGMLKIHFNISIIHILISNHYFFCSKNQLLFEKDSWYIIKIIEIEAKKRQRSRSKINSYRNIIDEQLVHGRVRVEIHEVEAILFHLTISNWFIETKIIKSLSYRKRIYIELIHLDFIFSSSKTHFPLFILGFSE